MRIQTMAAESLSDYFRCVHRIEDQIKQETESSRPPVLWFRGLNDIFHSLIPSIYRGEASVKMDTFGLQYSDLHYAEEIRVQHYIAKNFDQFDKTPMSRVEWLEVMQHQMAATRMLDWSESSIHSLMFAVEQNIDEKVYKQKRNEDGVPCVWVLAPRALNRAIFEEIRNKKDTVLDLFFEDDRWKESEREQILDLLDRFFEFNSGTKNRNGTEHMDYILNLSVIYNEVPKDIIKLKEMMLKRKCLNPYYYILSRIYVEGDIQEDRDFPPLAIVQAYHSQRIKQQHGVFTAFPFYREHENEKELRKSGIVFDGMEKNMLAGSCLYQIILKDPKSIADELMSNGVYQSWLYPELPTIANEIEHHEVYG